MKDEDQQQLAVLKEEFARLAGEVAGLGWVSSGSVLRRFVPCGKPGCRCQDDPPKLHGPYWQWTGKVAGKTVTRRLTEGQARLYLDWVANRRRLSKLVAQLEEVSARAAAILLNDPQLNATEPRKAPERARSRAKRP